VKQVDALLQRMAQVGMEEINAGVDDAHLYAVTRRPVPHFRRADAEHAPRDAVLHGTGRVVRGASPLRRRPRVVRGKADFPRRRAQTAARSGPQFSQSATSPGTTGAGGAVPDHRVFLARHGVAEGFGKFGGGQRAGQSPDDAKGNDQAGEGGMPPLRRTQFAQTTHVIRGIAEAQDSPGSGFPGACGALQPSAKTACVQRRHPQNVLPHLTCFVPSEIGEFAPVSSIFGLGEGTGGRVSDRTKETVP